MQAFASGPLSEGSPLSLPRERWEDHPRFTTQTLLLRSHESFRRTSRRLIARAESGSDALAIRWMFHVWKGAMHGHERYEELKLYPYLARRWGLSFEPTLAGHEALARAEAEVHARFEASGPATPALGTALRNHDRVLIEHLALEEGLVIPALLALEPAEFEMYLRSDIQTLLAGLGPA